jgi:NADH:ubiquinone oxidoreductase subunit H
MYFLYYLVLGLILIVCLLINIAFYTVAERKVMGSIQRRKGPNVVGFFGMLQPLVDGAKLIWKEIIIPGQASNFIFLFAPALTFSLSLVN